MLENRFKWFDIIRFTNGNCLTKTPYRINIDLQKFFVKSLFGISFFCFGKDVIIKGTKIKEIRYLLFIMVILNLHLQ